MADEEFSAFKFVTCLIGILAMPLGALLTMLTMSLVPFGYGALLSAGMVLLRYVIKIDVRRRLKHNEMQPPEDWPW